MLTEKKPKQAGEKSSIQVVDRMVSLLEVLSASSGSATLKQLAQTTGLHPSTAHRILAALAVSSLVERDENGNYCLGIRLLELGNLVKSRINIRQIALPHMQRLHESLGESVNLGIRHGDEIIYVERTSSGRSLVRVVYLVGGRAPLHLTSVGKLFLAEESRADVEAYAMRTGLPGKTDYSLVTVPALLAELQQIKDRGIAEDREEAELGLRCVAAPIRDDDGQLVAGLSVSAPADRHRPDWVAEIQATALEISKAMGYPSKRS